MLWTVHTVKMPCYLCLLIIYCVTRREFFTSQLLCCVNKLFGWVQSAKFFAISDILAPITSNNAFILWVHISSESEIFFVLYATERPFNSLSQHLISHHVPESVIQWITSHSLLMFTFFDHTHLFSVTRLGMKGRNLNWTYFLESSERHLRMPSVKGYLAFSREIWGEFFPRTNRFTEDCLGRTKLNLLFNDQVVFTLSNNL